MANDKPQTIDGLRKAAILLNRMDLLADSEGDSLMYNRAEKAVRDAIALIENPQPWIRTMPLRWTVESMSGFDVLVGKGLGLKYQVAKNVDGPGWTWVFGNDSGSEPTEEAARAVCETDFSDRIRIHILPTADN